MPPKPEDVREEPLTAVLLADSFAKEALSDNTADVQRMPPITSECPKVLLPLVNAPLIEYMLEWLAMSGVQKVHVLCCSHADQVRSYLNKSIKWAASDMTLNIISSYNCLSAGEALRLVDQEGLIQDDFILISGDIVTNMDLTRALAQHKSRRMADKAAIMTVVVSAGVDESQRVLMGMPDLFITLDPDTNRILSYTDAPDGGSVEVDAAVFSERDAIAVRADLSDVGIYICAPEVLVLFSDNFDFQHIQRDFIRGVLSEEELGNMLFVHMLQNEYAAHVANMRAYAAISRDILNRWAYPLCPDSNLLPASPGIYGEPGPAPDYFMWNGCRYKESSVKDDRRAVVGELCCLGAGTRVMDDATVARSVIGRHCTIRPGATVEDSFVMSGVTIGAGAQVRRAIVCDGATVGTDAKVCEGSVVGFQCVVGAGHTVPKHARVTLCSLHDGTSDLEAGISGHVRSRSGLDDDSGDEDQPLYSPAPTILAAAEQATHLTDRDMLTSVALPTADLALQRAKLLSMQADAGQSAEEEDAGVAERSMSPEAVFQREVQETLLRTMLLAEESDTATSSMTDNAVIELNGLKIAEVRTFADCARYVLTTLMDLQSTPSAAVLPAFHSLFAVTQPDIATTEGSVKLLTSFKRSLAVWAPTLQKFLHDDDDHFELLLTLEEYCARRGLFEQVPGAGALFVPIFSNVLYELYEMDIIREEVFLEWEAQKLLDDEADQEFLKHAQKFLDILKEEESDEESEDDNEDSNDATHGDED